MKLIDSKPARDIFSLPTTGMGFFGQKKWATLPATGPTTLDGIYTATAPAAGEQTAASSIHLGAPVLSDAAGAQAPPGQRPSLWMPVRGCSPSPSRTGWIPRTRCVGPLGDR
ncbi:hypothetical protein ABT071_21375 [Streptomyces sp. NPDC002506]|uniref:hypothetical protein n=1 Tax=Streptomyces sp. NPDC002506 TaxID=3154536 RepID=UPI00331B4C69